MKALPVPVSRVLNEAADELTVERVWRRVAATRSGETLRAQARRPVRWAFATAGLAALVAATVVGWGLSRRTVSDAGPLRLANGQELDVHPFVAGTSALDVALSDGSHLVVAPGTRLELLENTGHSFTLLMLDGRTAFDVRPGGPRRWTIEAGLGSVEVVGTHFTVARGPDRLHVDVERGTVLVRSDRLPERVRKLTASEFVDVTESPAPKAPATEASSTPAPPTRHSQHPAHPAAAPARKAEVPPSTPAVAAAEKAPEPARDSPEWKSLAREGDYATAYQSLGSTGVAKETVRTPRAEDLFALADIARYSGHPASAVSPLEEIVLHHRDDPAASLAAFTLGKIQLDSLNDPRRAAEAFAQVIELEAPPGLMESAYVRLVEARSKAGDQDGARAAATGYLKRFPNGQYRAEMSAWASGK